MTESEAANMKKANETGGGKEVRKPYEPTPSELKAIQAWLDRRRDTTTRPTMKIELKGSVATITPDHPEPGVALILLGKAMGTTDSAFRSELMVQLANASGKGRTPNEDALNFMLAVIEGIGPRDQMEAMLAAQMAAVHSATMRFARSLAHAESTVQVDCCERTFNKLARTFAVQLEALKRYRTGGEQKMVVQHVHVNEGGQAIVGNVAASTAGGGGASKEVPPAP
jgi:hypothetical protein